MEGNLDWKGRHFDIQPYVEKVLLPAMMYRVIESMQARGIEFRTDVLIHLNRATIAPLANLPDLTAQTIARLTCDHCEALLGSVAEDDLRGLMFTVCLFIEKLVAEELFKDADNQAVLAAMLIVEEAKTDDQAGWPEVKKKYLDRASGLLRRANQRGLFVKWLVA